MTLRMVSVHRDFVLVERGDQIVAKDILTGDATVRFVANRLP
jgi:hypothetical protein